MASALPHRQAERLHATAGRRKVGDENDPLDEPVSHEAILGSRRGRAPGIPLGRGVSDPRSVVLVRSAA